MKNGKAEAVEDVHQIVLLSIDLKLDGYEESKIETIDNCTSHCNLCVEIHVYRLQRGRTREVGGRNQLLVNNPMKCVVNVFFM